MNESTVPDRMLGCWKRRYIRFADDRVDYATEVIWLQTQSAMVDIRIPRRTLDYTGTGSLRECSDAQLLELALQDCNTGVTRLDEKTRPHATARWQAGDDDVYFQPVVNFPEDGWFSWREGDTCMMEWAPSGAYEEDWRLLQDSSRPLGSFTHYHGETHEMLFIAGDHAVFVRDRKALEIEARPLQEIVAAKIRHREYVLSLLDCEFSYARRERPGQEYIIQLSTLPFREQESLDLAFVMEAQSSGHTVVDPASGKTWIARSWYANSIEEG